MLQKVLLVALLSLLLGGFGIVYFGPDVGPDLSAPAAGGGTTNGHVEAQAANAAARPADATTTAENGAERAMAAVFDDATQRPLPDNPQWLEVKVVEKATGSPLAGAVVHWFDETAWQYLNDKNDGDSQEQRELNWQGERMAELAGWRTRSDAQGVARVTLKESTTVLAQHGALHGKLHLRGNTVAPVGGYSVELVPDVSLTVRVVDDRGTPTGNVPITIAVLDKDGDQVSGFGWSSIARSRAPDGLATIAHLQSLRTEMFGNGESGPGKFEWHVRLFLPGFPDPGVAFDHENPPPEPIELRLPPYGSIRVRAEFAGKPLPGFRSAWLTQEREGREQRYQANCAARVGPDGQARFSFVPLAQEYQIGSEVIGGLNGKFRGPQQAGQEVEAVLAPRDDAMLIAGRLVRSDRTPVVEQPIRVRVQGPQLRSQPELRTDRDGRFLVNLGSPRKDNRVDQLWFELYQKGEPPRRAEAPGRTLRPGIDELGDLVLGDGDLLVAGSFVANGKPFTQPITVRVEREQVADGRPRWRPIDGQLAYQDGGGAFSIRGTLAPGRHRLSASSERTLPIVPIEFTLGATDVVVTIDPGQSLAASVLLPDKAPSEFVSVVLVPATPPPPPAAGEQRREDRLKQGLDGQRGNRHDVRWPSVPAGTYSLEVRLWAVARPMVTIADVVLPLPAAGDARLVDIDLRPLVHVVAFDLRQPDGNALGDADGVAFPTTQASTTEWLGYGFWSSQARVLLPAGAYDLLVCASGYRPQPARGSGDRAEVRLDRWPTLVVHVAEIPKLPERARVQVSLQPTEKSELRYRTQWSSGDASEYMAAPRRNAQVVDGKASVPIGDGLYGLKLTVSANRRSHTIEGHDPQQVLSTAGEVTVTVPKAQWDKAIEVVKQPPPPNQGFPTFPK